MTLRQQAEAIWRAGVSAVDSAALVRRALTLDTTGLHIGDQTIALEPIQRIVVVGAGKAGTGMAAGLEAVLGPAIVENKVTGWVNVPSDCVRTLQRIHLHAARPAGINEPRPEGVRGSEQILELVSGLSHDDLCIVLISGGGSALLPAPVPGISLQDKLAVTRCLAQAGATIHELNTVRKRLSRIKGGGLLRAAKAGRMISLIISDVPGDPLDIIASAPTLCDDGTAADALKVLERFVSRDDPQSPIPASIWNVLDEEVRKTSVASERTGQATNLDKPADSDSSATVIPCSNYVIGNNQTALDAAAAEARKLGYEVRLLGTDRQGIASDVGRELAEICLSTHVEAPELGICFLAGGEPTVKLAKTDKPRRGGRNQEVALSAGCRLMNENIDRIVVLSGGTDGEDGPTDAAGAVFDAATQQMVMTLKLNPEEFLAINDSYTFFERVGGLLKTGPTHTNVMDVQVALVAGPSK